jgi:hypothetical protein
MDRQSNGKWCGSNHTHVYHELGWIHNVLSRSTCVSYEFTGKSEGIVHFCDKRQQQWMNAFRVYSSCSHYSCQLCLSIYLLLWWVERIMKSHEQQMSGCDRYEKPIKCLVFNCITSLQWAKVILMLEQMLTPRERMLALLKYSRPIGTDKTKRTFVVKWRRNVITFTKINS